MPGLTSYNPGLNLSKSKKTEAILNVKLFLLYQQTVTIQVTDVLGNILIKLPSQELSDGENSIDIGLGEKINSGIYFLKITTNKRSVVKKIIKVN